MMEVSAATASSDAYQGGSGSPTPAAAPTGEVGVERHYRAGAGGIGTFIAWGWALSSVISFMISLGQSRYIPPAAMFHGVVSATSWVSLTIFIILMMLHFRCKVAAALSDNAKHFMVMAHSGIWGIVVLVSSSVLTGLGSVGGLPASVVFGFFEAFALFGVVGLTVLNLMGHCHAYQMHVSNSQLSVVCS